MAGVTAWGAWLGRGQRGGKDYFLGGRDLPWGAVLLSVVATETSTLTFLSIPGVSYFGTLGFLQIALGYLAGRAVVAWVLLPAYYRGELATAYEMLEGTFGGGVRRLASGAFMITRLLADSVRLFATAIPLALITGWPYPASIAVIGGVTLVYTYFGGIRAVVWVDVLQMGLYVLGGLAAAAVLQAAVPGGWGAIAERAAAAGKLSVLDLSFDLSAPYTLWAGLLGGAFLSMGSHGVDQLIVQRLLTCRDLAASRRALVGSGLAVILQFGLFLLVGLGLWAFYEGQAFGRPDEIFAGFVVTELPVGLRGLLIAGVFAAAMSSLSSSINSLASATAYDFWAPARGLGSGRARRGGSPADVSDAAGGMGGPHGSDAVGRTGGAREAEVAAAEDDRRILRAGRFFTLLWAVLLVGGAVLFIPLSQEAAAVEVALGIASLVYGGLLGGFALSLLAPRAPPWAAATAMGAGIGVVTLVWALARAAVAWPWFVLIGTAVTTGVGLLLARGGAGGAAPDVPAGRSG